MSYQSETQQKNIAWFLPRPKPDKYKGGMPLYCEEWLIALASDLLNKSINSLKILNLFCGMNKYGLRIDLNKKVKPNIIADAHKLPINNLKFDIILADPPYSNEESKKLYNTPNLNYKIWTKEADRLLKPLGLLIVYHKYVMPNPDPKKYLVIKRVFIGNRTYHLLRAAIYFQKGTK